MRHFGALPGCSECHALQGQAGKEWRRGGGKVGREGRGERGGGGMSGKRGEG